MAQFLMERSQNPFTPAAGKMPPVLVGRESLICDLEEALDNGAGAPGRLMLISGQLGFGKTVMLAELGRRAEEHGWTVLSDMASHGLCDRLLSVLEESEIAAVNPSAASLRLRIAVESRFENMQVGLGVLFAIDEAKTASEENLVAVATAIQHVLRDGVCAMFRMTESMVWRSCWLPCRRRSMRCSTTRY